MHIAALSSSSFMTLHCITSAEETMVFASQQHELKNQSTALALPARLSCTISRRLSISVSKALLSKSSVPQIQTGSRIDIMFSDSRVCLLKASLGDNPLKILTHCNFFAQRSDTFQTLPPSAHHFPKNSGEHMAECTTVS